MDRIYIRKTCLQIEKKIRQVARHIGWEHYFSEGSWKVPPDEFIQDAAKELNQFKGSISSYNVQAVDSGRYRIDITFPQTVDSIAIEMFVTKGRLKCDSGN